MELPLMYKKIKKSDDLQNYFDLLYDFTLIPPTEDSLKRGFKTEESVVCFGTDACGGTYALVGAGDVEKRPVAFISSEGQAGVIAKNFEGFVSLLVAIPFWVDVLKFSGGGKISEMEKAYNKLEKETVQDMNELLEDDDDPRRYKAVQALLIKNLELKSIAKPVETFYEAVGSKPELKVYAKKDNRLYDSLFSPFTVQNNPLWKS